MESLHINYGWSIESFNSGIYFVSVSCGTPQTRKSAFFSTVDMLVVTSFRVGNVRNGTKQLTPPYGIAPHKLWLVHRIIQQRHLFRFGQLWHPSDTEERVFQYSRHARRHIILCWKCTKRDQTTDPVVWNRFT